MTRKPPNSFIKWVGGKRQLAGQIISIFAEFGFDSTFGPYPGTYWEPFVGGGAVFYRVAERFARCRLSDINDSLIDAYFAVKADPDGVVSRMRVHAEMHSPEYFLEQRDIYNGSSHGQGSYVDRGARLIYIMRACYNGKYHVLKNGKLGTTFGCQDKRIVYADDIADCSAALQHASVEACSFEDIRPGPGDIVYCDPPYYGTADVYTADGFSVEKHKTLALCARAWRDAGAYVVLSNNDNQFIRDIYSDCEIRVLYTYRYLCPGANKSRDIVVVMTPSTGAARNMAFAAQDKNVAKGEQLSL